MLHRLHSCALLVAIAVLAIAAPTAATPITKHAASPVCGPFLGAALTEPPIVEVADLPRNATGEPELILAVHADTSKRFCYTYRADGVEHIAAPTIRVRRGQRFALRIVNDITAPSAGERVSSKALQPCMPAMSMGRTPAAHYAGYFNHTIDDSWYPKAAVDTNIHLHGFQGPADQEDIFLSTLSTPMHACEYHITIPTTQPPGTYFYHPHIHGASDAEVAGGLSGAWIVEPDVAQLPASADHVLLLRYRRPVMLDNAFVPDDGAIYATGATHEGALPIGKPVAFDPFNPPAWPLPYPMHVGAITEDATGCNGIGAEATLTVNGAAVPATLDVAAGQAQLLRLVDTTSDSPKQLSLHDASGAVVPMRVVGRDGTPISGDSARPLANYVAMDQVMLAPASRVDALVTVAVGQTLTLSNEHFCGGANAFFETHHDLLHVRGVASDAPAVTVASTPVIASTTPAAKLVAYAHANPHVIHRRAITFTEYNIPGRSKVPPHSAFFITETSAKNFREHPFSPVFAPGGTVPSNPDIVVKAGTVEEWYLINASMEAHTFHIHQMTFVNERDQAGIPIALDEVFVPVGSLLPNPRDPNYPLVKPSITRILLDFRHVPRGTFVFHCHMLYHEDRGMMGVIRVE